MHRTQDIIYKTVIVVDVITCPQLFNVANSLKQPQHKATYNVACKDRKKCKLNFLYKNTEVHVNFIHNSSVLDMVHQQFKLDGDTARPLYNPPWLPPIHTLSVGYYYY
jgi:hypothetical protein